jgi:SnoaL-like domain
MSERNVESLRAFIDAFNTRDFEALIAYADPSIKLHSVLAVGGEVVYHDHDGLRSWQRDIEGAWGEQIRVEPEAYFDLGDDTLVFYVLRGRGRRSGAEVAMPIAGVGTWCDGLIVYWKTYIQRESALNDLGISEDELERIEP